MMSRDSVITGMLADLARATEVRRQHMATPAAADARLALRRWQAARLAHTHADLLASPRYGKAAAFFLTDLYGADATAMPYAEAERAMPMTVRLLPHSGLETLADAWKLDALSETLDAAMIDTLGGKAKNLTPARYAAAYRTVGQPDNRARQIELIAALAEALQRFSRKRYAKSALAMMREPARLAGFGDLQAFLTRGLEALLAACDVAPFIETVTQRERTIMRALLAGDASPLEWAPEAEGWVDRASGGSAPRAD
jgi:hypothetical protein